MGMKIFANGHLFNVVKTTDKWIIKKKICSVIRKNTFNFLKKNVRFRIFDFFSKKIKK